jgi:hypothetical protein
MLKKNWVALTTVLVLTIITIVFFSSKLYKPAELGSVLFSASTSGTVSKNTQSIAPSVSASIEGTKIATDRSSALAQPASTSASFTGGHKTATGLLGENLRKLMNSNALTKIDYAESRIRPWCMVSVKRASERDVILARMSASIVRDKQRILSGGTRNFENGGIDSMSFAKSVLKTFRSQAKNLSVSN